MSFGAHECSLMGHLGGAQANCFPAKTAKKGRKKAIGQLQMLVTLAV